MNDQQLDEIAAHAAHLHEYAQQTGEGDQLAGTDVPALIETVRRLRAQLDASARLAGRLETKLRDLGAPATVDSVTVELESGTRPCGHDDYHDPHEWADRPGTWCPGISYADDQPAAPAVRSAAD